MAPKQWEENKLSFTRNFLKTMSLTDEQVQAIMEEHLSVTDSLKAQRDKFEQDAKTYKEQADKVPELEKQIQGYKDGDDYKKRFEDEHKAFEDLKAQIAKEAETAKVRAAYRQLLIDEKINEKRVDSVIKLTDFSEMKLDKDGKLENIDTLKENIGKEWGEFKVTTKERKQTVPVGNHDNNGGNGESRARELYLKHLEQRNGVKENAGKE